MNSTIPLDLITVKDAMQILGISHSKIAQLLKDGTIRYFPNPLDRREKLISQAEIEALRMKRTKAA